MGPVFEGWVEAQEVSGKDPLRGCPSAALLLRSVGVARGEPAQVPPTAATRIPRPAQAGAAPVGLGLVYPGVSHVWVGMVMKDLFSTFLRLGLNFC